MDKNQFKSFLLLILILLIFAIYISFGIIIIDGIIYKIFKKSLLFKEFLKLL